MIDSIKATKSHIELCTIYLIDHEKSLRKGIKSFDFLISISLQPCNINMNSKV